MFRSFYHSLRRFLRYLARPVRHGRNQSGLHIQPYRGYGTRERIYLMGRVFRQLGRGSVAPAGSLLRDAIDLLRRLFRYGAGHVELIASRDGQEIHVITDPDGYFAIDMAPGALDEAHLWHQLELRIAGADLPSEPVQARFYVPPTSARFVVISDIDDTVMYTGVANKVKMVWRLFMQGAKSRTAFPGVGALYRALHEGRGEHDRNPMLYVSRGPWSIYEMLETFFHLHHIPVGPILFLREWGLTLQRPLPRKSLGHKLALIKHMLEVYNDLPFILIGDSGQHDPDIYADVVRRHPGRVMAIYIRNVSKSAERVAEIEKLAAEMATAGSPLVLASDTFAMAEHAARQGFISPQRLQDVLREREEEAEPGDPAPEPLEQSGPHDIARKLDDGDPDGRPASIEVKPDHPD